MRTIALVAVLVLAAGCGGEEGSSLPNLEDSMFRVEGDAIICDDPYSQFCYSATEGGPYVHCGCLWRHVTYDGQECCQVMVVYRRYDPADPWGEPTIYTSPMSVCAD
jgi:hypothetical protein